MPDYLETFAHSFASGYSDCAAGQLAQHQELRDALLQFKAGCDRRERILLDVILTRLGFPSGTQLLEQSRYLPEAAAQLEMPCEIARKYLKLLQRKLEQELHAHRVVLPPLHLGPSTSLPLANASSETGANYGSAAPGTWRPRVGSSRIAVLATFTVAAPLIVLTVAWLSIVPPIVPEIAALENSSLGARGTVNSWIHYDLSPRSAVIINEALQDKPDYPAAQATAGKVSGDDALAAARVLRVPDGGRSPWLRPVMVDGNQIIVGDYESNAKRINLNTGFVTGEAEIRHLSTIASRGQFTVGMRPDGQAFRIRAGIMDVREFVKIHDSGPWISNSGTIDPWMQYIGLSSSKGRAYAFSENGAPLFDWIPPGAECAWHICSDRIDSILYAAIHGQEGGSTIAAERNDVPGQAPSPSTRVESKFALRVSDMAAMMNGGIAVVFENAELAVLPNPYWQAMPMGWKASRIVQLQTPDGEPFEPSRITIDAENGFLWATCNRPSNQILGFSLSALE